MSIYIQYTGVNLPNSSGINLNGLTLFQHNNLDINIINSGAITGSLISLAYLNSNLSLVSGDVPATLATGTSYTYRFVPNTSGITSSISGGFTFTINTGTFSNHFIWTTASGAKINNKSLGATWQCTPRLSYPILSVVSGSSPYINYLTPDYEIWYKYRNYVVKNNHLIELDKVGQNSGSLHTIYISYLRASGSLPVYISVNGFTTTTTGFVLTSGVTQSFTISGSPSTSRFNGSFVVTATGDIAQPVHTTYLQQDILTTGYKYVTQISSSGGYNIFDIVDVRNGQTVCRWHTNYSRANGSVGFTSNRCTTTSTGYIVDGGYDVEYTATNNLSVTGLIDDLKPIWRAPGPLGMFFYDFRAAGGIIISGVAPASTWYDSNRYDYPNDADLPFFVFEPSGTNRRILVSIQAQFGKGYPYEMGAFRLHNYHPTLSASNDIPNPEKWWSVTFISRRANDEQTYFVSPSDSLRYLFSVRVQDQTDDVRDIVFPYRQFYKLAVATGLRYTPNKTAIAGDLLYQISSHPRSNFFTTNITNSTGWTQVSGNVYNLLLNSSGVSNFYWLWDEVNDIPVFPIYQTGDITSVNNNSGTWCVETGSATGLLLRVHSDISNPTGYLFSPQANKPAHVPNYKIYASGWSQVASDLYNRSYTSGWPRVLNWSYGGRSPSSDAFSFHIAYDLFNRPDIYGSGYYDLNTLKNVGSSSGSNIAVGAYWGLAADPQNDFHFPTSNLTPFDSLGLMSISKELDAIKALNMKFVSLDAAPKSTYTMNKSISYLNFINKYTKSWATGGIYTEASRADILMPYAGTYSPIATLFKSITVSTGTNVLTELLPSGFGSKFIRAIFDDNYSWLGELRTSSLTTSPASLNTTERSIIVNNLVKSMVSHNFIPLTLDGNSFFSKDHITPTGTFTVNAGPVSNSALIRWDDYKNRIWVDNIDSYRIYRAASGAIIDSPELLGVATTSSYLDIGLSSGVYYTYYLTLVNKYGRESDLGTGVVYFLDSTGVDSMSSIGTFIPRVITSTDIQPIGADDTLLIADSAQSKGVRWGVPCANSLTQDVTISNVSTNLSEVWTKQTISSGSLTIYYTITPTFNSLSLTIDIPDAESQVLSLPTGSSSYVIPVDIQVQTPNNTATLTLTAQNDCDSTTYEHDVYWRQKAFYGTFNAASITTGDLTGFSSVFTSNGNISFNVSAAQDEYIYFVFRSAAGTPKFTDEDSGLSGGFEYVNSLTYNNPYGYSETYNVYKTVYTGFGSTNIQVTY